MSLKLKAQAFTDLARHYSGTFKQFWRIRRQLDGEKLHFHEVEFLPAALSLQSAPPSPAPRVAMWLIMGLLGSALVWSIVGHIDITASAQGKVVPDGRTKVIQPMETAAVRAIHVVDGQEVKAGDVLVELDATAAHADVDKTAEELATAKLQVARERALVEAIDLRRAPTPAWPAEVARARVLQEATLLDGEYRDFVAKRERLQAERGHNEAELRTAQTLIEKLQKTVPLAQVKADNYADMVRQNLVPRHAYLDTERQLVEDKADLVTQRRRLDESKASTAQAQSELVALVTDTRRTALEALNDASQKAADLSRELLKAQSRDQYMTLRAPVPGTVQQLAVHTVGGVVTPGQPLLSVVPADASVEVEAQIENKDIGFITVGQDVELKVDTFLYTKYGTVEGRVQAIARDAVQDDKKELLYPVQIRLKRSAINVDGRLVKLVPGMRGTVEIKTGRRKIVDYLLSPLIQHTHEAGRER
jgi:hemolysin D